MKNLLKFIPILFFITFLPLVTFAANTDCTTLDGIGKLLCQAHRILNSVLPVLVALGVVYLVWGVVQYVIGDADEAKKKGRDTIIYGLIGLAVIIGFLGVVERDFLGFFF